MKKKLSLIPMAVMLCICLLSCEKVTVTDDDWVDLGLPSGTLWASCNVGAESPQDDGYYFAWGETVPKTTFTDDNYTCRTIYDGSNDWAMTLLPSDDAATASMGSPARMPTKDDWNELLSYCEVKDSKYHGKKGMIVTGMNGSSLFLPAAGRRYGSGLDGSGSDLYYWSASLCESYPNYAYFFDSSHRRSVVYYYTSNNDYFYGYRCYGLSVRAVRSQN